MPSRTSVEPKDEISDDLLAHLRYPEDLFKVQREVLARYHVTDPATFYGGSENWEVPEDPTPEHRPQAAAVLPDGPAAGDGLRSSR